MKTLIAFICGAAILLAACGPECRPNTTRCNGSTVELCDSGGDWYEVMNCDEFGETDDITWSCCTATIDFLDFENVHTCRPTDQCLERDR